MTVVVNSGQLKHVILFRKKDRQPDGGGSFVEAWVDHAQDRVRVLPISAAERIRGNKDEVVITHFLSGRYRNDVNKAMRIFFGGRILEIVWIINVEEANVENQYLCKEIK